MAVFSIIKKSQLEGAKRLDAEYYQPENLRLAKQLRLIPTVHLADIAFITDGEHGSPIWDETSGIKYFSAQHVRDGFIDDTNAEFIAKSIDEKNKRSRLKVGDILLSTVGTIGFAGLVTKDILPANIDRHVARIALKEKTISPEFLVAFLNSAFGRFQSIREATGNVQLNIFIDKIKEFVIPAKEFPDVASLMNKALQKREDSELLYSQAEGLLLKELGLENFEEEVGLWSVVQLSEAQAAGRIDSEYFQPKYERVVERIKNQKHATIEEVSAFVGHATQSPYDERGSIAVLAQKHMKRDLHIEVNGFDNFTTDDLIKKNDKKYVLKKGDILISSAGEPGLTSVWTGERGQKVIPGSFVTVVRLKGDIDPLYLGVFLNTPAGKLQFERDYTGSVQQYVYPSKIKNILVPILPEKMQQKIAELVRESHTARAKSRELLEAAKRKVEELIESPTS